MKIGLHVMIFSRKYLRMVPQKKQISLKQMGLRPCAAVIFSLHVFAEMDNSSK